MVVDRLEVLGRHGKPGYVIHLEETEGGLTSVAYEPHGASKFYGGWFVFVPAFVLWLAREPLR